MMTQKDLPYIKLFTSLRGIKMVFWMSPNLNILCTSSEKRYYTLQLPMNSITTFSCCT